MATGISHEIVDGNAVVTFNVTGNTAKEANLVLIKNGEEVTKLPLGAVEMGINTKTAKFVDLTIENGKYNYAIEVISEIAGNDPVQVYKAAAVSNQRLGVATITDPENDNYGTVVFARNRGGGFDILSPMGEITNYLKNTAVFNGMTSHISAYGRKGAILVSSWSDAGSGIFVYDLTTPSILPDQLFAGTRNSDGLFTYNGKGIGGSENGIGVSYDGTQIYAFSEELHNGDGSIYNVGSGPLSAGCITEPPVFSETMISVASSLANAGADASPLVRDGAYATATTPYGVMVGQGRAQKDRWPYYIFWDPATDKTLTYRDGDIFTSSAAGCAFNKDLTLFAHMKYTGDVQVHNVTWETTDGMTHPVISAPIYSFPAFTTYGQIVFDAANNLYVTNNYYNANSPYAYAVYALPGEHAAQTPAKAADLMDVVVTSGIADIKADAEVTPVYYNLQGVRVENPGQGIFIEVRGSKATKVVR